MEFSKRRVSGLLSLPMLALAACTSGDGGGSVSPAGGQDADPVVLDFPIAYAKHPVPAADVPVTDARSLMGFEEGGDLWIRDRASPSAPETATWPPGLPLPRSGWTRTGPSCGRSRRRTPR